MKKIPAAFQIVDITSLVTVFEDHESVPRDIFTMQATGVLKSSSKLKPNAFLSTMQLFYPNLLYNVVQGIRVRMECATGFQRSCSGEERHFRSIMYPAQKIRGQRKTKLL